MFRVFANGPGDLGSIPGRVIPKTQKMVLDAILLNTQHYKVRIKGKIEQSRERSSALPYTSVQQLSKREPSGYHRLRSSTLLTCYIRDDIDFLNSISQKNTDPDILMVTFVTNLYSDFPLELGKRNILFSIEKYPETLHPRFNKKMFTDRIELILNNNSLKFDNINYIQALETAPRSKMAPMYVILTLAYSEENPYEIIGKKCNNNIKTKFIRSWKRYLDDCFIFQKCP